MNSNTFRALLKDAYYQVMDNWVFRLLVIGVLCLVAPTFIVSMRETEVVLLFGLFDWGVVEYEPFFEAFAGFGLRHTPGNAYNVEAVQWIQDIVIQRLVGNIGILLCIAATASFVPHMIQKGEADVLFSKPVGRLTLLLTRYFTGILFVTVLAVILIGGMHTGFLLFSGYSDPGFLWGAVTLVYLFAMIQAVSVLIATLTRSPIAAILLSAVFYMGTGLVHLGWTGIQFARDQANFAAMMQAAGEPDDEEVDPFADEEISTFWRFALGTLNTLHYVLPKTSDADALTKLLRRSLSGPAYALADEESHLEIESIPEGFTGPDERDVDLDSVPAVWARGTGTASIELALSRKLGRAEDGGRRITPQRAAKALVTELEGRSLEAHRNRETLEIVAAAYAVQVDWSERSGAADVHRQVTFFSLGNWLFSFDATFGAEVEEEERREIVRQHLGGAKFVDPVKIGLSRWYLKRFTPTAPWRFNVFFSIGSTLAFCALMLGAAWFRLSRIDF